MVLSPTLARLLRFGAVGVLNSLVGYAIYAALVFVGLVPEIALLIATVLGVIFNFFTTGRMVFGSSDNKLFFRFATVYAVIYACNALALRGLLNLSFSPLIAQAVLMPVSIVATFTAMRLLVFRETRE